MLTKHMINFIYFIQVAGFHKLWTYWNHEFFHVEDKRSFLGGHFAKRSPNFWLVPFRMFLGGMWFYEGIQKLSKVIEDPNAIFLLVSKIDTSGATPEEGAEVVAEVVQALPVPEFITNIVNWSMDLVFYTPAGDFTFMSYNLV